jgi:peroxidase
MINLLFTGIQTMFLRAHNMIAKDLFLIHPDWSDNKIYEKTRRLTTGYFQKVVYDDWLPILLGKNVLQDGVDPTTGLTTYNDQVNISCKK